MALSLVVELPDGSSQAVSLAGEEVVLGRDPQNGVALADAKVSRRHARIVRRAGAYWLEDLGSANGVILDGLPLSGQALVSAGSVAEVGDCTLRFVNVNPQAAAADDAQRESARPSARYASPEGAQHDAVGTHFALRVMEGELLGQTFVLKLAETIVGRGEDADLTLEVPSISRRHAAIRQIDDQRIAVEDLGSANGTYIGDAAIGQARELMVGEQFRLGSVLLEVTRADEAIESMRRPTPSSAPTGQPNQAAAAAPPTVPVVEAASGGGGSGPSGAPARAKPARWSIRLHKTRQLASATKHAVTAGLSKRSRAAVAAVALVGLLASLVWWRSARSPAAGRDAAGPARAGRADIAARGPSLRELLLGYGPKSAEREWQGRRDEALADAMAAAEREEWEHAQESLHRALKLDPTCPRSLRLRAQIESAMLVEASTQQALAHRAAGRWSQSLIAASDALRELGASAAPDAKRGPESGKPTEDGAQQAPTVPASAAAVAKATELSFVVADARNHLAAFCREESRIACSQERYDACISQAACALGYDPNDEQALAALSLAAAVVDPQGSARPVTGPGKDQGIDVGSAPLLGGQALAIAAPDAGIRMALQAYAAGDMPQATLRLRNLESEAAEAVLADLAALEVQRARGAGAEDRSAWDEALPAYKKALEVDARLLPASVPCGPRTRLIEAMQRALFALGETAQAQGNFGEALAAWQHAASLRAGFLPAAQGLFRLERRATELLDAASRDAAKQHKLSRDEVCATIAQATAMTDETSDVHKRALSMAKRCRN